MNTNITVTIERRADFLRLRWNDGKRRSLALGLRETPANRAFATATRKKIENDWADGKYDATLLNYKPQTTGSNATDITAPELFKRFTAHKIKCGDISPHTASIAYRGLESSLRKHLNIEVSSIDRKAAESLADKFTQTITPLTAKSRLGLLKACFDWAKGSYQVAEKNPWDSLASRFRTIDKKDTEPFSRDEVRSIIDSFKSSKNYSHYVDFVIFLFGIGCRQGEAVALKWKSIKPDFSSVWIGESQTGKFKNPTTKTKKARNVILPPTIAAMLKARMEERKPQPGDLVFPELNGGSIDCCKFRHKWERVLKNAGVRYCRPYSTRHTAISHALENGARPIDVASQCGHSIQTLLEKYAHVIQQKQVFHEF
jgi:integrase